MASCLFPRQVLVKSAFQAACQERGQDKFWRDRNGINRPMAFNKVVLPCGKCINCLKKRQDSFVVRIQEEAKKRGNMCFITLTYDEEHIPLSQSLWSINDDTGEMSLESTPEILCSARSDEQFFRAKFKSIRASHSARYLDVSLFDGLSLRPGYSFVARITPSVCREDVRLWLKRSRVRYEREHGFKLNDFVYIMVPEYGFQSCRPHYHLLTFGLTSLEVSWLCKQWEYGYTKKDYIHQFNEDGSDAYALVSRYISKYMTKGRFECDSVRDRCAEKPRVCQSMGIGKDIIDKVRDYVYCYDMYGRYDLDRLTFDSGERLTSEQVQALVKEIPNRLSYSPDGKYRYPLPKLFVNKLFKEKITFKDNEQDRVILRPFKIWTLVTDYLSKLNDDLYNRELRQFCSENSQRTLAENLVAFQVSREVSSQFADKAREKTLLAQLAKTRY